MNKWLEVTGFSLGLGILGGVIYSASEFAITQAFNLNTSLVVAGISAGISLSCSVAFICVNNALNKHSEKDKEIKKMGDELEDIEEVLAKQERQRQQIQRELESERNRFEQLKAKERREQAAFNLDISQQNNTDAPTPPRLVKIKTSSPPTQTEYPSIVSTRKQRLFGSIKGLEKRINENDNAQHEIEDAMEQLLHEQDEMQNMHKLSRNQQAKFSA